MTEIAARMSAIRVRAGLRDRLGPPSARMRSTVAHRQSPARPVRSAESAAEMARYTT
jgi:hypothetical protein